jgi:hypothetical protein
LQAHGFWFDHQGLAASHRWVPRVMGRRACLPAFAAHFGLRAAAADSHAPMPTACPHLLRRRNDKARHFLLQLRQSQMFEVFVGERLEMFADIQGGPEFSGEFSAVCVFKHQRVAAAAAGNSTACTWR